MNKFWVVLAVLSLLGCQSEAPSEAGSRGPAGANGADGVAGPAGERGATGPQGPQGPQGPTGPAGSRGLQGVQGQDGQTGPQGTQGLQGGQGPQGQQGLQGIPGPAGTAAGGGAAAQVVTCSQLSRFSSADGRVVIEYWAKIDDARITPNSLASVSAWTCGLTQAPAPQNPCTQPGATCSGTINPKPTCTNAMVNIDTGRVWVSCGRDDTLNGQPLSTYKYATAHISYRIGS